MRGNCLKVLIQCGKWNVSIRVCDFGIAELYLPAILEELEEAILHFAVSLAMPYRVSTACWLVESTEDSPCVRFIVCPSASARDVSSPELALIKARYSNNDLVSVPVPGDPLLVTHRCVMYGNADDEPGKLWIV